MDTVWAALLRRLRLFFPSQKAEYPSCPEAKRGLQASLPFSTSPAYCNPMEDELGPVCSTGRAKLGVGITGSTEMPGGRRSRETVPMASPCWASPPCSPQSLCSSFPINSNKVFLPELNWTLFLLFATLTIVSQLEM